MIVKDPEAGYIGCFSIKCEGVMSTATLAISLGEPSGIGPDILIQAAQTKRTASWLIFGAATVLQERAKILNLPLRLEPYSTDLCLSKEPGELTIVDYPCVNGVKAGCLDATNSVSVLAALTAAANYCQACSGRALVTLPIHKGIINSANIPFTGHTEYLAKQCSVAKVVMMLGSARLNVALQTIHVPLSRVPSLITAVELTSTLAIIRHYWQKFYAKNPRVLVLGLNPHAGEDGYLGCEEQAIIIPTLQRLRTEGYALLGPLAADTAFTPQILANCDVVLAMYHDQGLAPLKALEFGKIVNYTLGLPYIRTSVDHGVALDIAGTGQAVINSFLTAVAAAEYLLQQG